MHPDRLAVKTNNYTLTYDELNKAANRVACAILAQPGNVEEPVALQQKTAKRLRQRLWCATQQKRQKSAFASS
jgi:non-ribosomal peptide synthetase component E (peptide arylation enzyme)